MHVHVGDKQLCLEQKTGVSGARTVVYGRKKISCILLYMIRKHGRVFKYTEIKKKRKIVTNLRM